MNSTLRVFPGSSCRTAWAIPAAMCALALVGSGAAQARGQWGQTTKLTATTAAGGDRFGVFVAISGGIAVVGAFRDDDEGLNSGSVYLFDVATGEQLGKLIAADTAQSDGFGVSVGISGGIAVVGALEDDTEGGDNSGSAYLFDVATGEQLHKLTADDAESYDEFGVSVSISEGIAIVGAHLHDDVGGESGAAYLFDVATGEQLHKLTGNDLTMSDRFGTSVGISGGVAVVGAPSHDDAGIISGSAYLFDVATGEQLHKLTTDDPGSIDQFGISVAISGGIAIVGVNGDDDAGGNSGSAFLFDVATGEQLHKLTALDAAMGDNFGVSVSISGNIAIVGAVLDNNADSETGSAYLFDAVTGEQLGKLIAKDAANGDRFGVSVAYSSGFAIVGADRDDDAGSESGSAYVFEHSFPCPADLDGDGQVRVPDLILLLASWGPCGGCPADIFPDGSVRVSDLVILLSNWGPCP